MFPELELDSGAVISPCGNYRYSLWRIWDKKLPLLGYVLLNPSTADAKQNDHTIQRLMERARRLGFGGIIVVNIFAYRSTDPSQLYRVQNPIGFENDKYIVSEMQRCPRVICGWGRHGKLLARDGAVLRLLYRAGVVPHALSVNFDGTPEHPLYLSYDVKPVIYMTDWVTM